MNLRQKLANALTEVGDATQIDSTVAPQPVNAQVNAVMENQPNQLTTVSTELPKTDMPSTATVDSSLGDYSSEGADDGLDIASSGSGGTDKLASELPPGGHTPEGVFRNDGSQGQNPQTVLTETNQNGLMNAGSKTAALYGVLLKQSASSCGGRKKKGKLKAKVKLSASSCSGGAKKKRKGKVAPKLMAY